MKKLRLFRVYGWMQYRTDCAKPIDRMQLATSKEEAKEFVTKGKSPNDWKFYLMTETRAPGVLQSSEETK